MPKELAYRLGEPEAALLRLEPLSIVAASRGAQNVPFVTRALGKRVSEDLRRVTLFFSAADAHRMRADIEANGCIAVVLTSAPTHHAVQLKGSDAKVEKVLKSDVKVIASYRKAFVEELGKLGYPPPAIEALVTPETEEYFAVTFTPEAAFSQTPGPKAGRAIESAPEMARGTR